MHVAKGPDRHLFVCVHRRSEGDPLGPGCGAAGDAVYSAAKALIARRGTVTREWATRALCLGFCPRRGATVAAYPAGKISVGVTEADVATLFEEA